MLEGLVQDCALPPTPPIGLSWSSRDGEQRQGWIRLGGRCGTKIPSLQPWCLFYGAAIPKLQTTTVDSLV